MADASFVYFPRLGVVQGTVAEKGLRALERHRAVSNVALAPSFFLIGAAPISASAIDAGIEWGVKTIGAKDLWERGLTGAGVTVGHLDSGVAKHIALNPAIGPFAAFDVLGRKLGPSSHYGIGGHGTHTAGIICARAHNNAYYGVAPGANLCVALAIDEGDFYRERVLAGLEWILLQRPRILNMSIGVEKGAAIFADIMKRVRAAGILPIGAIGNVYPGPSCAPANLTTVLSVGACAEDQTMWPGSASERFDREERSLVPDLAAPGVAIHSCAPKGGIALASGTSQAAPHVAGLAALLAQASPKASAGQLEDAILLSCHRAETLPQDRANRGLPNASRALAILLKGSA
ncbi:MAG: S8 family serine peptidase [Phycisphaerales bacterium]|nr:S8 family serine peptidase [Hyphomonadaceae bacterium]